eukprot:SAG31_NODE_1800_length_7238_cov_4.818602_5_plen_59_part_00
MRLREKVKEGFQRRRVHVPGSIRYVLVGTCLLNLVRPPYLGTRRPPRAAGLLNLVHVR